MNSGLRFDENASCQACGCFGAFEFEDECLCTDCYAQRGSCCAEFEPAKRESCAPQIKLDSPPPPG